jgi:hypothetical protein
VRQDGFREGARVNAKAFIALLKISWTKACERRIRRFNLEVMLLALRRPNDIDPVVVHRGVGRFKIAPQDQVG